MIRIELFVDFMTLIELPETQRRDYNDFVAAQESGSFLQSWQWGEWQERLGRKVYRYFVKDGDGRTIASLQLIQVSLPFRQYYLYCPYGPIVNSRWAADEKQLFELIKLLKIKFPDVLFFRLEPKDLSVPAIHSPLFITKSLNIQPGKTLIIDLSQSEDQLLAGMHAKTRYNIRLSKKRGVKVQSDLFVTSGHGLYFQEVVEQIVQTGKRQRFKSYEADYYRKMVDFFILQRPGEIKIQIYKAMFGNELLASAIMLDFAKTRTFLFGGSSEQNRNVMAPYLLHWQAMLDAKLAGFRRYDFWGVETAKGDVPGFVRFKLGFGGQVKEYSGAYDIVVGSFMYKLYRILRKIKQIF